MGEADGPGTRLAARVERLGDRLAGSADATPVRRAVARLLVDLGQVNAIGTTAVAMQEAATSHVPVTQRRIAVLAGLITASWILLAELIRALYAVAGRLGPPGRALDACLDALGSGFDALTSVDVMDPASTPVGSAFLGLSPSRSSSRGGTWLAFTRAQSTGPQVDAYAVYA